MFAHERTCAIGAAVALCAAAAQADIPVVELVGPVHAVSAAHVTAAIARADAQRAPLLVVRLDTPGGLDSSMRQVIDAILTARTPVAAFVGPSGARAASAGFLITVVADVAAMAPGTNMGAATPVSALGPMDETMARKVTSDMAAYIRGKVERRGRNVELAEKAVLEARSFTESEALKAGLIELVVPDVAGLVAALEGREVRRFDGTRVRLHLAGQRVVPVEMAWNQRVLSMLARPELMFLLLLGALAGLGTEISHPGMLFPGVIGLLCLILFLFASQVLPVNGAGVLLILLAVGLFAAEVKVASYGLLTAGGIVAMILGAMMLVDAPIAEMQIPWTTLAPAAIGTAAGTIVLLRLVLKAQQRRASTGREGMLDRRGVAEGELDPEGWVRVAGERWRAVADGRVAAGEPVVVTAVEGLTLRVRKGA